jgi:hypothetical protein
MRIFQFIIFAGICFILSSCSTSSLLDYKEVAEKYNLPKSVEQSDYPEADGVVLYSTTDNKMEISTNSVTTELTIHIMKKLFKNIESYSFIEIPIYDGERIFNVSARTIRTDGTIVSLKQVDFHQSIGEGSGSTFYSDERKLKFTFPSIEKNCIIEYKYTKIRDHPFMNETWVIQDEMPTLLNMYTLIIPKILLISKGLNGAGWDWNYKTYNYKLEDPIVDKSPMLKDKAAIIWTLKDIKPFEEEKMMPPALNFMGYVKYAPSEWKNWSNMSEWYYKELFAPQLIISDEIKSQSLKLTRGIENNSDKIRKIYDYVKDLRYVSINLGDGGWRPHKPAVVLEKQYGDCKDKSILLISLLKAADIESKPVLVLTSDEGKVDPTFPSADFNHMIVQVKLSDSEKCFIDPTAKYTPLGKLPSECQDINVLVLNPDNTSQIEKTPAPEPNDNTDNISLNMILKRDGTAEFTTEVKYYGASNSYIRHRLKDKTNKELNEYCKSLIADEFTKPEIINCTLSDLDSLKASCSLKFTGAAGNIIQSQGDLMLVSSDPFKFFESTAWLLKDKREFPIKFDYPFNLEKTITLKLPEGYSVRNLPKNLVQGIANIGYEKNLSTSGDVIKLDEKFRLSDALIPAANYQIIKKFFENIKEHYAEKIILVKKE